MVLGQTCCASVLPISTLMDGVTAVRTFDTQISAHERLAHVDVLDLDFNFVLLAIGRLATLEAAAGAE
jgi:hypothetical protein